MVWTKLNLYHLTLHSGYFNEFHLDQLNQLLIAIQFLLQRVVKFKLKNKPMYLSRIFLRFKQYNSVSFTYESFRLFLHNVWPAQSRWRSGSRLLPRSCCWPRSWWGPDSWAWCSGTPCKRGLRIYDRTRPSTCRCSSRWQILDLKCFYKTDTRTMKLKSELKIRFEIWFDS